MRNFLAFNLIKRSFSNAVQVAKKEPASDKTYLRMSGWQIHSYGDLEELQFSKKLKRPIVRSPNELLVKIDASSVNPLDVEMIKGYGSTAFNTLRCNYGGIEFPLTLGRDFVGTVMQKGLGENHYNVGDKIWGVIPVHRQGCHTEYITIDSCYVSEKPKNVSDTEAASVLYAGLTAYSGIFLSGQLNGLKGLICDSVSSSGTGKKVLVLGGSGGVGNIAVQILLAEGAEVLTTCSPDVVPLLQNIGLSRVIDYTAAESDDILIKESPYDMIIDCASKSGDYANVLPWSFKSYVTFKSPGLRNFDEKGLLYGGLSSLKDIVSQNITSMYNNGTIKWGYFVPSKTGILYLKNLVENGKLKPLIDSKFPYNELPKAYEKVAQGHLRGKVVVEFN